MFRFKEFSIDDSECAMKVGTDGVLLGSWADVEGAMNIVDAGCGSDLPDDGPARSTSENLWSGY